MAPLRCRRLFLLPCANNIDELYILVLSNTGAFFHHILSACLSPLLDPLFLTDSVGNSCFLRLSFPLSYILYNTGSALCEASRKPLTVGRNLVSQAPNLLRATAFEIFGAFEFRV